MAAGSKNASVVMKVIADRRSIDFLEQFGSQNRFWSADMSSPLAEAKNVHCVAIHDREFVRDEENRKPPIALQAGYEFVQPPLTGLINSRRQLVEQENIWFAQQRKCDQQALKLAPGESPYRGFRGLGGNTHKRQRLGDI